MIYRLTPPEDIISTAVDLPLSKSESARALVIDAVAGTATTAEVANCDDTAAIAAGLAQHDGYVYIGAAGTAMRFLTAFYAATPGCDVVLDGTERMRQRPIGALVDALRAIGADIVYAGQEGFPPLHIRGKRLSGGTVTLRADISSQFVSALMMVAPLMAEPLTVRFDGEPVSAAYIRLPADMMRRRGVDVQLTPMAVEVPKGEYNSEQLKISADWSAASYWYEITAISSAWVTLPGLTYPSMQGDSAMAKIGYQIGVSTGLPAANPFDDTEDEDEDDDTPFQDPAVFNPEALRGAEALMLSPSPEMYGRLDLDMSDTPDLVPAMAVTAGLLGIPFTFTGVSTLRTKETDRIAAIAAVALKLGMVFDTDTADSLSWDGRRMPITVMPRIRTYDDHRMAMAFAPAALLIPGLMIEDPEVVSKSYPDFWRHLADAGFTIEQAEEEVPAES